MSESILHLPRLSPDHEARLVASGIARDQILARGYYTERSGAALGRLGYSRNQQQTPALVMPVWGLDGRTKLYQIRPDCPRVSRGREVKYETPAGSQLVLDIPPSAVAKVLEPDTPLLITEGIIKADAASMHGLTCIASLGIYGWGKDFETWNRIPLRGRKLLIAFDSDIRTKHEVRVAAGKLAEFLKIRGAKVEFILFAEGDAGSKVGLDDYLAAGGSVEQLLALSVGELPEASGGTGEQSDGAGRYESTEAGTFKITAGKNGDCRSQLANLSAKITAEVIYRENDARPREFEIEVKLNGAVRNIVVTAQDFERMSWVIDRLGGGAILSAGFTVRDELRAAIQHNSGAIPELNGFDRLGWADLNGDGSEWGYIHAGGVITAESAIPVADPQEYRPDPKTSDGRGLEPDGPIRPISGPMSRKSEIRVHHLSSSLSRYRLPKPPSGELLRNAIRISLGFLDLAPDRITVPLYAGMWRVMIDVVRFSLFIAGPSGIGKTELAAALVQHFGGGLDSEHPTDSFASTAFSTASSAHQAGNVVYLIDDFVLGGSPGKDQRLQDHAEHLIRSQGNRVGRNRCNRDGSTQGGKESRALYCITGEATPHGESLGARYFNLEAQPGDILDLSPGETTKSERLKRYQDLARQGYPAMAAAGFIQYIAANYEQHRSLLHQRKVEARETSFRGKAAHARVIDIAADLLAGLDVYIRFGIEVGAFDEAESEALWDRVHEALWDALKAQDRHHVEQDPARRLLGLLGSAMTTGRAYLLTIADDGHRFEWGSPKNWGYEEKEFRVATNISDGPSSGTNPAREARASDTDEDNYEMKTSLVPRGDQVGWRHCDNLYFDPDRALGIAQRIAWEAKEPPLPPGKKVLGKRLDKLGLLASKDADRNTARPLIDGKKTDVWHIRVDKFYEFIDPGDEHWEARRDRDALAEHEEAERRREELGKARDARVRKAADFMQAQFLTLLDPEPAYTTNPSTDTSGPEERTSPTLAVHPDQRFDGESCHPPADPSSDEGEDSSNDVSAE